MSFQKHELHCRLLLLTAFVCRTQQRRRLIVIAQSFYKERVSALADVGGVKVFRAPSGYGTVELTIVDSEWSVPSSTMIYATGLKGDVWQGFRQDLCAKLFAGSG